MIPSAAAGGAVAITNFGRSLSFPAAAMIMLLENIWPCARTRAASISNSLTFSRYAVSAIDVAGSTWSPSTSISRLTSPGKSNPIDMEMTLAPSRAAHITPSRIASVEPAPWSSRTLPINALVTPGATPMRSPFTEPPKIVPAQCVPWPSRSPLPSPEKSFSISVFPVNASCCASMPVSSTATVTPSPLNGPSSAPTARTPQVVSPSVAGAASSLSRTGATSRTGITRATASDSGSRCSSPTSLGVSVLVSTLRSRSRNSSVLLRVELNTLVDVRPGAFKTTVLLSSHAFLLNSRRSVSRVTAGAALRLPANPIVPERTHCHSSTRSHSGSADGG